MRLFYIHLKMVHPIMFFVAFGMKPSCFFLVFYESFVLFFFSFGFNARLFMTLIINHIF